ncbi:pancreatic lipase-related protein 2-like [Ostrinia furnacalis]|uniref:pancreatic lipase-related protein 2-like n=1 Tax=Ostrinia furnacalis TaxID=93504 RepID=UPI00103F0FC5|nr:pancreatic lipase-related protein 2-like [Ostrinia furnacalis]
MFSPLLLLVASTAYIASALPLENDVIGVEKTYPRFIEFPDGEGKMHTVDLEAEPDWKILDEITRNPANNRYFLFTRRNSNTAQSLVMNDPESIRNSYYNPRVPTVVISHGWLSSHNTDINPVIRDAYLAKSDVNIIVLDWRRLAIADYITAVRGVPAVGRGLGQFISFLINTAGGNLNYFHLVGFSLGAHLVGNAGRELGGRVARITGLDPAGPLWNYNSKRINENDGIYVEAIHTDGGLNGLGIGSAVANADFFPNGGTNQPGCLTGICDHNRAWELFAATVTHNHLIGMQCSNNLQITLNTCRGDTLYMGNDNLKKTGNGMFRVNTRRRYPF